MKQHALKNTSAKNFNGEREREIEREKEKEKEMGVEELLCLITLPP